jgi:hypothetical protein
MFDRELKLGRKRRGERHCSTPVGISASVGHKNSGVADARNDTPFSGGNAWRSYRQLRAPLSHECDWSVEFTERPSKEVSSMKRLGVMLFTLVLSVSLAVIAQEAGTQQPAGSTTSSTTKMGAKLQHLKGKISDDGKSFTTDKENKTYSIENSEAVKGHEGHDVRLSGHVDESNNSIHVASVKMASQKKPMSEQPPK